MDLYQFGKSIPVRSYEHTPDASRNFPLAVAFLPDGSSVTSGAPRGEVKLWDLISQEHMQSLEHHGRFLIVSIIQS